LNQFLQKQLRALRAENRELREKVKKLESKCAPPQRLPVPPSRAGAGRGWGENQRRDGIRAMMVADRTGTDAWTIGQRIRAAREKRGWTQQTLADESGIARANIARLEAGRHEPKLETLSRVAQALSVEVAGLVETQVHARTGKDASWLDSAIEDEPAVEAKDNRRSSP